MENEIEIKLIVSKNIEANLEKFSKNQNVKIVSQHHELANIYFDTEQKQLREWDIGLRIRVNGSHIEQTIKTSGEIIGGLHQRPEYNIDIVGKSPLLNLFPQHIWPKNCKLSQLQEPIKPLFSTDFNRNSMMMIFTDGSVVDMVFDQGFISANDKKIEICEVELELVKGKPQLLFNLAEQLSSISPVRFGTVSKAARGYQLANNSTNDLIHLSAVDIYAHDSLEHAYRETISHALNHWQYNVELFIETHDYLALKEIKQGLQMMIKANELYQDYLQQTDVKSLTKQLFWLMEQLSFVDNYVWITKLLANKGHKIKKLADYKKIIKHLETQQQALPSIEKITELFNSSQHTKLVSSMMQWLYFQPWRHQMQAAIAEKFQNTQLRSAAKQFLNQDWEAVTQSLPYESSLGYQDYLAQRQNLQHHMQVGLCVGHCFNQSTQHNFRASWVDISVGIDQLLQFEPIRQLLRDQTVNDNEGVIKAWLTRKEQSLISAMELSRKQALKMVPYWL